MSAKPSKTWVFTINNWTEDDITLMGNWNSPEFVNRLTVTKEVGESGTPHLQGAVTFIVAKRMSALKKLHSKAHWEVAVASDAALYCLKDGSDVVVNADHRTPGRTKAFAKCVELIRAGELKRVREEYPEEYCRHGRKFKEYYRDVVPAKHREREVFWYWGKTGTGKTRKAVEEAGEDMWMSSGSLQWFDGYTGQANVIIDDIRPGTVPFHYLLRVLDRYAMKVPIKGDMVNWDATKIWITGPQPPHIMYATQASNPEDNVDQLLRRIKLIKEFV